jgi:Fur family peroxide stress response transcriptional regulator
MERTAAARLEAMAAKVKASGLKLTPQRLSIMRLLAESEDHPGVDDIRIRLKRRFPGISQATVYRTIQLVKSLGEACEIAFAGGGSRYDGRKPHPHPHVICLGCGRILDPELESLKDMTDEITAASGFEIHVFRLDFFGMCPACLGNKNKKRKSLGGKG